MSDIFYLSRSMRGDLRPGERLETAPCTTVISGVDHAVTYRRIDANKRLNTALYAGVVERIARGSTKILASLKELHECLCAFLDDRLSSMHPNKFSTAVPVGAVPHSLPLHVPSCHLAAYKPREENT